MKLFKTLVALCLFAAATPAYAHFPWLTISEHGNVQYFFGENPADCTYKLPGAIAKSDIELVTAKGTKEKLELSPIETDDFVGRTTSQAIDRNSLLQSQVTFGIYHGSRLDYYTVHYGGKLPASLEDSNKHSSDLTLKANLVDTEHGVDAYITWKGQPLVDADVQLFCEEGHQDASKKTDSDGKVSFTDKEVEDGLNGIMVGHTLKDERGTLNDKKYESTSHYLTVTFKDPQDFEK
ncbi:hypothetical protein C5Y96_17445 [Blastopirellula marina]|uniref:DUF4198 domain-containing protein n=1 Tax=Blastopirellula marina TaxID=124 RepID=A0A2S8F5A3_9BACT|nr:MULTISPECIES: hypothetical protein [Pirellulaceae]PQO27328.1 hypothetical protein C5Y96_17445 [Blastopirellula marina]RCS47865.1 hypothetical protein DTL36_17470 [Bremerella cremea]